MHLRSIKRPPTASIHIDWTAYTDVADGPTNFHQMINIAHRTTNHQMSQGSVFVKPADYRPRDILLG
ncbi:hypothetical protein BHYA_0024g00660 [Botrytis hyacinthi]|uniref:Uncharacterized protein n=1 Tax=Botrytis hyacinthi TaxID=278943 RepID=A0A4Z1GWJ8_9HELO|nr:hypothetical protein BHYA_0024g00660 [Botrytis hyacinthi]